MVGYATVYTMFPVFSLVVDYDVADSIVMLYPELYNDLTKVGTAPALAGVRAGPASRSYTALIPAHVWHASRAGR
jgi:hypothetical protein